MVKQLRSKGVPTSIALLKKFPHIPQEERIRFHKAFGEEAVDRLEEYQKWKERCNHILTEIDRSDEAHWETAIQEVGFLLPQLIFCHLLENNEALKDVKGNRVMQHVPAQINPIAPSTEAYAQTLALYLYQKFDPSVDEQVTLLIDVRPGVGWPNPPALQMVNFIKQVAHYLHDRFPGRLCQCIIYPVPRPAMFIWQIIRGFLRKSITQAITLVPGSDAMDAAPPNSRLSRYIDCVEGLELIERTRKAAFASRTS